MKASLLVVALPLVALLAGCIGDSGAPPRTGTDDCTSSLDQEGLRLVDPETDILAEMTSESQWDFEMVNKRTCTLPAIGHSPLSPDGVPHKYIGEIDMRGDLGIGAVAVLGNGEAPRVYLVDIHDRADPQVLSSIDQQNTYIVDVKISDDGGLLFTATQKLPTSPELSGFEALEGPTGFTVYDISDPTKPNQLNTHIDPQIGCHMLSHEIIGGTDVLFCISQQMRAYTLDRATGSAIVTGAYDYAPAAGPAGLPLISGPPVAGDPAGVLSSRPHDMTVKKDEKDGRTYAVVSHWDSGVRVVDVTDFPKMNEVGVWTGDGATHYDGNIHTAMMFYAGEDRYLIASPEYTYDGVVPSLWVLDANDLSDLKLVAEWFHPGEHESQGLFLTTHQWQVAPTGPDVNASDVRIYLTYNHGGIWVLDLGQILAKDNQRAILGFNAARSPLDEDKDIGNAVLSTWDVNVVDGYIYGSDRATGLWVFHYQGDPLGDERYTGFA